LEKIWPSQSEGKPVANTGQTTVKDARKITEAFLQDAFTARILSLYQYYGIQKEPLANGLIPDLLLFPSKDASSPGVMSEFKRPWFLLKNANDHNQTSSYSLELASKYPRLSRMSIIYTNGWGIRFGL